MMMASMSPKKVDPTFTELIEAELIGESISTTGLTVSDTQVTYVYPDDTSIVFDLLPTRRMGTVTSKDEYGATIFVLNFVYGFYSSLQKITKTENNVTSDFVVFNYNENQELASAYIPDEDDTHYYETPLIRPFPPSGGSIDPTSTTLATPSAIGEMGAYEDCLQGCDDAWLMGKNTALGIYIAAQTANIAALIMNMIKCAGVSLCLGWMAIAHLIIAVGILAVYISALVNLDIAREGCRRGCASTFNQPEPADDPMYQTFPDPNEEEDE